MKKKSIDRQALEVAFMLIQTYTRQLTMYNGGRYNVPKTLGRWIARLKKTGDIK